MGLAEIFADHPFWVWAAVAAGLLAVEVVSGSGWLLWPAASAAAVALLRLVFDLPIVTELMIFAGLTIVSTLLARRYFPRSAVEGADINDNIGRLIGQEAEAVQAFSRGHGRVAIDGKEWAAELEEGETLARGAAVQVTGVSGGSRLRVRPSSR